MESANVVVSAEYQYSSHHGLQADASVIAVKVGIGNEVLDGLKELLEDTALKREGWKNVSWSVAFNSCFAARSEICDAYPGEVWLQAC